MGDFIQQPEKKLMPAIIIEGKSPEEREYLVLYIGTDDEGNDVKSYEFITGREDTYKFIKGMIEYIDIYDSRVLVETVPFSDALTVYEFMKLAKKHIVDPSFDIEDYNYGGEANEDKDLDNMSNPNNFI